MTAKTIAPEIRTILGSLEWDGPRARLTCGQLDRKVYQKVNEVLEAFGGKWDRKTKAHVFADVAQDELDVAIETGVFVSAKDIKQIFGEFETPDGLADELIEQARIDVAANMTVLEPSAGGGQLLRAIKRIHGAAALYLVDSVEIQGKHHKTLSALGDAVFITDFMAWAPESPFDRVVMNPPFAKQADVDHVTRAFGFLNPGGRLVAIMSPGWTFRENAKSKAFRKLVESQGSYKNNPPAAFKCAGTNVNTVMVTLEK